MPVRTLSVAASAAALVAAFAVAPAHADIESRQLVCTGTVKPGVLHDAEVSGSPATITCTQNDVTGYVSGPFVLYDGPATVNAHNVVVAPGVVDTYGFEIVFYVGSQRWGVFAYGSHPSVDGVMPFQGFPLLDDIVSPTPYGDETRRFHIREGQVVDTTVCVQASPPAFTVNTCPHDEHDFFLVAEVVFDYPF